MNKITFDKKANAAYLYIVDIGSADVVRTQECDVDQMLGSINLDFDKDNRLVGIEIINANQVLPKRLIDELSK